MNCPVCSNEIVLGRSTVWVREDGLVAHVKCDPLPPRRAEVAPGRSDFGAVAILRRTPKGWAVEVEGVEVFAATSGTAIGRWKREHAPNLRLERDPDVVQAEDEQRASRDRRALDRLSTRKSRR